MQYKFIPPKLIARELLEINDIEYNIFCFHGKVEYIRAINIGLNHKVLGTKFFSTTWSEQEFYSNASKIDQDIPKPNRLPEILKITTALAADFDFVRVDLFLLKDENLRFSELTFSPSAGKMKFCPDSSAKSIDEKLGKLWKLPERDPDGFSKQGRWILDAMIDDQNPVVHRHQ
jgi:hypothetical protein